MRVRPLTGMFHPDFNDGVIHFAGRVAPGRPGQTNAAIDIQPCSPRERLMRILTERRLRGFTMFNTGHRAVCFTESTRRGVEWLISTGRYPPYGVGFTKQSVFSRSGGPALYVRGDEWPATSQWPGALRARATRFWPGADATEEGEYLSHEVSTRSEFLEEREWRALPNEDGDWHFDLAEITFIIVADERFLADVIEGQDETMAADLTALPHLVVDQFGTIVQNNGVPLKAD